MTTSPHRPYRPLGPQQLGRLQARLELAHEQWHRRWFKGDIVRSITVECEAASNPPEVESDEWLECNSQGVSTYLALTDERCGEILSTWLGAGSDSTWREGVTTSALLTRRILGDWFGGLSESGPNAASEPTVIWSRKSPPPELYATCSGAVCVRLQTWFGSLLAVFDDKAVQAVQPSPVRPASNDPRRMPLRQAIQAAQVRLQVSATATSKLSIGALHSLSVGDVMLLVLALACL